MAWARAGGTDQYRSADLSECMAYAGPPVLTRKVPVRHGFWEAAEDHRYNRRIQNAQQYRQQVFHNCMVGRGYRLVEAGYVDMVRAGDW